MNPPVTGEGAVAHETRRRWSLGIFAALAMLLLSLFPQFDLCWRRGREWQGAYAYAHYDEDIYAAYLNGLILGRPRRSDPLVEPQQGQLPPESLFSIQFVSPYLLAIIARATGLSAAQIYLAVSPVLAMLTALLLFYLLVLLTGDHRLAGVGSLFVLCFGALAARDGKLNHLLHNEVWYAGFPFLRRYQPGPSFLLLFLFVVFVWWAFTRRKREGGLAVIAAGLVFAVLVFSYYYLWTVALAWLLIMVILWLIARPAESRWLLRRLSPLIVIGTVAVAWYILLLIRIAGNTGSSQALEHSRMPDLWRGPELIGALVLAALIWLARRKQASWRDPPILLTGSFALLPFALFNQQVVTGLSLQPFHYEVFIGNYLVLLAAVLTLALYRRQVMIPWRPLSSRAFFALCLITLVWGVTEIRYSTIRERERNLERDRFVPVARRLNELARRQDGVREVVFSPDTFVVADNTAGYAPQALLWATHMVFMPSLNVPERKIRFFEYLYYCGVTPEQLERQLSRNSFVETAALFGYERYMPNLTVGFKPLGVEELRQKVAEYGEFVATFDDARAMHPTLAYVIVRAGSQMEFSRLDRWYLRAPAEVIGDYQLFRVTLRNAQQ